MFSLVVIFAAITIGTEVYSGPIHEIDLEDILKYANAQEKSQGRNKYGSFKGQELAELVQKATEDDGQIDKREYRDAEELLNELNSKHNKKVVFGHYLDKDSNLDKNALENDEDNEFNENDKSYKHSRFNEQALEELLSNSAKKYHNDQNDDSAEDEYSKVYIILNPQAIEKSNNKESLNKLITKILSLTSSPQERSKKSKDRQYKGFPLKLNSFARRARHESREAFGKDTAEDDYKPKRVRSEWGNSGGGGGGPGGRTAIPYIRNRGDIYERGH